MDGSTEIHHKIGNPLQKKKKRGGHQKSPKTDEPRPENAPIEKQKTQRKTGNPSKKRGHRKSPKTNEPRPEKRLAPPKIAQKSDSNGFQVTRRERERAGEREAGSLPLLSKI